MFSTQVIHWDISLYSPAQFWMDNANGQVQELYHEKGKVTLMRKMGIKKKWDSVVASWLPIIAGAVIHPTNIYFLSFLKERDQ